MDCDCRAQTRSAEKAPDRAARRLLGTFASENGNGAEPSRYVDAPRHIGWVGRIIEYVLHQRRHRRVSPCGGHVNHTNRPNTGLHRPALQREESSSQLGAIHTWRELQFAATLDGVEETGAVFEVKFIRG
jgi:hypothetical protein